MALSVTDLPELIGEATVGDGCCPALLSQSSAFGLRWSHRYRHGAFGLVQRGTGTPVVLGAPLVSQNGAQTIVTLNFQGALTRGPSAALVDGYYQLTVDGSKISRTGITLDVNRDGVGGDTYLFGDQEVDKFFALFGDTDGDGQVGIAEFGQFRAAFGSTPGQAAYNALFDYDGSGVGISDFGQFRSRFGKRLLWT